MVNRSLFFCQECILYFFCCSSCYVDRNPRIAVWGGRLATVTYAVVALAVDPVLPTVNNAVARGGVERGVSQNVACTV